jgi:prolyl-tRNA synthetase
VYSKPLEAYFLDENGKQQPFIMGTYGIGVSRLIAAVIEQNHDEKGCIWTKATAPYFVDIIVSNGKKEQELETGIKIYEELKNNGIEVILDDRKKERFGFKMGDFELIGFPYAIIIGKKLQDGIVELVNRKTMQKEDIFIKDIIKTVKEKYSLT